MSPPGWRSHGAREGRRLIRQRDGVVVGVGREIKLPHSADNVVRV
jgi:hypothetical protein